MIKQAIVALIFVISSASYSKQMSNATDQQWIDNQFDLEALTTHYIRICINSSFKIEKNVQTQLCDLVAADLASSTSLRAITLGQYVGLSACSGEQNSWDNDCYTRDELISNHLRDAIVASLCYLKPTMVSDNEYGNYMKRGVKIYDGTQIIFYCNQQWFADDASYGEFTAHPDEIVFYKYPTHYENLEKTITNNRKEEFAKQVKSLTDLQFQAIGPRLLETALIDGEHFFVEALLSAGVKSSNADDYFNQPLVTALKYGRNESVKLLLSAGAKPNVFDENGSSALYLAVEFSSLEVIKLLLKLGVNVEGQLQGLGSESTRPLFKAAEFGRLDVFKLLLEAGARTEFPQIEANDYNTLSLLEMAMRGGNETIFNTLLGRGVALPNREGHLLIKSAIIGGNVNILNTLLSMGIQIPAEKHTDILFELKGGPWRANAAHVYREHVQYERHKQLDLLVQHGLKIEHRENGAFDYITRLISIYKDPAKENDPVTKKAREEELALTSRAIQHYKDAGLDLNYIESETLLMDAVSGEYLSLVELLLELGADKAVANESGKTALSIAGYKLSKKIKDYPKWQDNRADIEKIYYLLGGELADLPTIPDKQPLTVENLFRNMLKN